MVFAKKIQVQEPVGKKLSLASRIFKHTTPKLNGNGTHFVPKTVLEGTSLSRREALGFIGKAALVGLVATKTHGLFAMAGKGEEINAAVKKSDSLSSITELNCLYQAGNPTFILQQGRQDAYYTFDATAPLKAVKLTAFPEGVLPYYIDSPDGQSRRYLLLLPGAYGSINATVWLDKSGQVGCKFRACDSESQFQASAEQRVINFPDKTGLVVLMGSWVNVLTKDFAVSFDLTKFLKENGLESTNKLTIDFQPGYVVIGMPKKDGTIKQYGISLSDGILYAGN